MTASSRSRPRRSPAAGAWLAHLLDRRLELLVGGNRRPADRLLTLRPLDNDRGRAAEPEGVSLAGSLLDEGVPLRVVAIRIPLGDVGHPRALGDVRQEVVGDVPRVLASLVQVEDLQV